MKTTAIFFAFLTLVINGYSQITDSSKREVKLQGAVNFRDIGGYATKDGRHIKWGKIYRSAALNGLTGNDLDKLQKLLLSQVIDFRGPYEIKSAPDKVPISAKQINLPAGSENVGDSNYMKQMVKNMKNDSAILQFYSNLSPFQNRYKPFFDQLLLLNKDSSVLFHCTAGKDRTGIAAALLLYALGVDKQTIMQDYLATNYYRRTENEKAITGMVRMYGFDASVAKNMMAAKENYLNATFYSIESQYGSVDVYLQTSMGLTREKIEKLKQKFVE